MWGYGGYGSSKWRGQKNRLQSVDAGALLFQPHPSCDDGWTLNNGNTVLSFGAVSQSVCVCVCVYPISSALVFGMYQNILAEEASTQLYYVYTAPRIALRELVPVVGQSGSLLSWVMSC